GGETAGVVGRINAPASDETDHQFAGELRVVGILADGKGSSGIGNHLAGLHAFLDVAGADGSRFFFHGKAQGISEALPDQASSKPFVLGGTHGRNLIASGTDAGETLCREQETECGRGLSPYPQGQTRHSICATSSRSSRKSNTSR